MMSTIDVIQDIFSRCDLMIDGNIVSQEPIFQDEWKYLCKLKDGESKVGIVLHTGSKAYNAMILFFCILLSVVNRNTNNKKTVLSLKKGDMVIYTDSNGKTERYLFEKISTEYSNILQRKERFATLVQTGAREVRRKLPEALWDGISPYYGESASLDGKGLRKLNSLKNEFYRSVVYREPPNLLDTSVIFICSKQYYEQLFDNCSIYFNGKEISFADIATASFYTDSVEIPHTGNAAKTEPMLKFTSSFEFARQESLNKSANTLVGIVAIEDDIISKNLSQLPQIVNLRRLPLFLASVRIDAPCAEEFGNITEKKILYFACTKNNLKNYNGKISQKNVYTIEVQKQIQRSIEHRSELRVIEDIFKDTSYSLLVDIIRNIKNDDFSSSEKDAFIINSYSFLKLLITAVFPLSDLDYLSITKSIETQSCDTRIQMLVELKSSLPIYLQKKADILIEGLIEAVNRIKINNEKEQILRAILSQNSTKKIAVLVNKSYYDAILSGRKLKTMVNCLGEIIITTPNRLNYNKNYDVIISTSGYYGNKFNPVECINAPLIYSILYKCELPYHKTLKKKHIQKLSIFNNEQALTNTTDEANHEDSEWFEEYPDTNTEYTQLSEADVEIESFIQQINQKADIKQYIRMGGGSVASTVNTVIVATFENGAKAFFSKMYKAYVFNEEETRINEIPVEELRNGDMVLFFRSSGQTKDLVDNILEHLIKNNKVSESIIKYYEMSKRWKMDLKEFQKQNAFSDSQFATYLKEYGVSVQEITIKQWLDEDSHTVAPHDPENLKYIGLCTKDEVLERNYLEYFNACREIRSLRKQILNYIGKAIVMRLSGEQPEKDEVYALIYSDIESMGELLEIKHIIKADNMVPINMINRPLTIKEW